MSGTRAAATRPTRWRSSCATGSRSSACTAWKRRSCPATPRAGASRPSSACATRAPPRASCRSRVCGRTTCATRSPARSGTSVATSSRPGSSADPFPGARPGPMVASGAFGQTHASGRALSGGGTAMAVDQARVEEMVGQLASHMTGAAICLSIWLGDELGYYGVLAAADDIDADALAEQVGCNPRLTREWLDSQAAAGLISYDAAKDRYAMSEEAEMLLADEAAPTFMARGMNSLIAMSSDAEKLREVFRGDGGLSWGDHHPCLFRGTEWFFRPGYRTSLTTECIAALDGVQQRLEAGGGVADIGCGHGDLVVVMADAYPN